MNTRQSGILIVCVVMMVMAWLLSSGCSGVSLKTIDKGGTVTYYEDNSCTVQSSATVLGLDVQIFDFMGSSSSSPQKIRLGYVSSQQQVTPKGVSANISKLYNLNSQTFDLNMNVDTGRDSTAPGVPDANAQMIASSNLDVTQGLLATKGVVSSTVQSAPAAAGLDINSITDQAKDWISQPENQEKAKSWLSQAWSWISKLF